MKLNILLIGGFLIVAILCGVVGYIAIDTFGNVEGVNAELQADIVPNAILMVETQKKANKVYLKGMEYIVYRKYKEKAVEIKEELKKAMDELKELVDKHFEFARHISKEKRKIAQQLLDEVTTFNYAVNGIIAFIDVQVGYTEDINEQIAEMEEETVGSAYRALAENLKEHKVEHMQEIEDANKTVTEAHITSRNTILITTLIIIILAIALGLFISCSISIPITKLREGAIEIGKGKLETKIEITSKNEIGELATAFNSMVENLQETSLENERYNWLNTGQSELDDRMRGDQPIDELCKNIITFVAKYLKVQVGTLYVNAGEGIYKLKAGYAYKTLKKLPSEFKTGEGLIGQAALEKESKVLTNVPEDYITVISGLGEKKPGNILVAPFIYNETVSGVLEVGSFDEFTELQTRFMEQISERIAIAINSSQARLQLQSAFEVTQAQAEEMESQQEELRAANEELEEQTQRLQASEEELKRQQEELQVLNEELEEKARALEERMKSEK